MTVRSSESLDDEGLAAPAGAAGFHATEDAGVEGEARLTPLPAPRPTTALLGGQLVVTSSSHPQPQSQQLEVVSLTPAPQSGNARQQQHRSVRFAAQSSMHGVDAAAALGLGGSAAAMLGAKRGLASSASKATGERGGAQSTGNAVPALRAKEAADQMLRATASAAVASIAPEFAVGNVASEQRAPRTFAPCAAVAAFADVLLLVEGVAVPAHRAILSARSPYFAMLLQAADAESDAAGTAYARAATGAGGTGTSAAWDAPRSVQAVTFMAAAPVSAPASVQLGVTSVAQTASPASGAASGAAAGAAAGAEVSARAGSPVASEGLHEDEPAQHGHSLFAATPLLASGTFASHHQGVSLTHSSVKPLISSSSRLNDVPAGPAAAMPAGSSALPSGGGVVIAQPDARLRAFLLALRHIYTDTLPHMAELDNISAAGDWAMHPDSGILAACAGESSVSLAGGLGGGHGSGSVMNHSSSGATGHLPSAAGASAVPSLAALSPAAEGRICLELLAEAQRLQLTRLSLYVQRLLEGTLSLRNAPALLCAADALDALPLRRACLRYILSAFEPLLAGAGLVRLPGRLLREILAARAELQSPLAGSRLSVGLGVRICVARRRREGVEPRADGTLRPPVHVQTLRRQKRRQAARGSAGTGAGSLSRSGSGSSMAEDAHGLAARDEVHDLFDDDDDDEDGDDGVSNGDPAGSGLGDAGAGSSLSAAVATRSNGQRSGLNSHSAASPAGSALRLDNDHDDNNDASDAALSDVEVLEEVVPRDALALDLLHSDSSSLSSSSELDSDSDSASAADSESTSDSDSDTDSD